MGNHNVQVTNPKGARNYVFLDNQTLDVCQKWLRETAPAPIGWTYEVVNLNKKVRKQPQYILITGWKDTPEGPDGYKVVGQRRAKTRMTNGQFLTGKMARRQLKAEGAMWFTHDKIW